MKHKNLLNISGMIVTLIAFALMATAMALGNIPWLFFTSIGVLLLGIVLSSVIPAYLTARWQRMMLDHGVPARARLANITVLGGRFGDIKLDFVTDDDISTSAFIGKLERHKFELDRYYEIRYNPADTEICLIMNLNEVGKESKPTEPTEPTEPTKPAEPNKSAEPSEPTEPTEPNKSAEPTEPTEPTKPAEPTEPESTESAEPEQNNSEEL